MQKGRTKTLKKGKQSVNICKTKYTQKSSTNMLER